MQRYGRPVSLSYGAVTFNVVVPPSVDAMPRRADELMYVVEGSGEDNLMQQAWPPGPHGGAQS